MKITSRQKTWTAVVLTLLCLTIVSCFYIAQNRADIEPSTSQSSHIPFDPYPTITRPNDVVKQGYVPVAP